MKRDNLHRWRLAVLLPTLLTPILLAAQPGRTDASESAATEMAAISTATETVRLAEGARKDGMPRTSRPQDQLFGSFLPHPKYIERFSHSALHFRMKPPRKKEPIGPDGLTTKEMLAASSERLAEQAKQGLSAPRVTTATESQVPGPMPTPLFSLPGAAPAGNDREGQP